MPSLNFKAIVRALLASSVIAPFIVAPAQAQLTVFDPTNLVQNALVHAFNTDASGVIKISMHTTPASDSITLTVTDDGKGIPEPLRERIWDPFFTTRRGEGGTGLGLHIVQRMVTELLGGAIAQGRPQQGHGCEFVVTIPKHAPLASEEAASPTTANHT